MTYQAEIRCMFCDCLLGHKDGFDCPSMVSHGIGECCAEFAISWHSIKEIKNALPEN